MDKLNLIEAYNALKEGKIIRDTETQFYYKIINNKVMYAHTVPDFSHNIGESSTFNMDKIYEIVEYSKEQEIKNLELLITGAQRGLMLYHGYAKSISTKESEESILESVQWAKSRIKQLESKNEQT